MTKTPFSSESKSFALYQNEVGRYPVLSTEEVVSLVRKIKAGDEYSRSKLIVSNLPFVISRAMKFQSYSVSLEDLVQEGNIGLMEAVDHFDETIGNRFTSYAIHWIEKRLHQAVSEVGRLVRLPENRVADLVALRRADGRLEAELQRTPGVSELAEATGLSEYEVDELNVLASPMQWLDEPIGYDEDTRDAYYFEVLGYQDADGELMQESMKQELALALDRLPVKEAHVLRMLYGVGVEYERSTEAVAATLGVSGERVRQLKASGLKHLQSVWDWDRSQPRLAA